jgi:hypothetical protein
VTPTQRLPGCERSVQDSHATSSGEIVVEYAGSDGGEYIEFTGHQGKQWLKTYLSMNLGAFAVLSIRRVRRR